VSDDIVLGFLFGCIFMGLLATAVVAAMDYRVRK
jgi:hypothetical protein